MISFSFHEDDSISTREGEQKYQADLRGELTNPYRGKLLRRPAEHEHIPISIPPHTATAVAMTTSPPLDATSLSASSDVSQMSKDELHTLWMNRLFNSLQGQEMLSINAHSKFHQWADVHVDAALHERGKRKRVLFYMGEPCVCVCLCVCVYLLLAAACEYIFILGEEHKRLLTSRSCVSVCLCVYVCFRVVRVFQYGGAGSAGRPSRCVPAQE
jgi:hypothetical protein